MATSSYRSQTLRKLALDLRAVVRDPRVSHALDLGIEDFDHELSELLRDHPALPYQATLWQHLDRGAELLRSQSVEPMILGLPDHLAKTARSRLAKHEEDLGQLGVVSLDTMTDKVVDFLSRAARAPVVGIARAGYETVKSPQPYKEALRQGLTLTAETAPLLLLSGPASPVILLITIGVYFTIGHEIVYKRISPHVADYLAAWAGRRGLVARFDRGLQKHPLLCKVGAAVRELAQEIDKRWDHSTHKGERVV